MKNCEHDCFNDKEICCNCITIEFPTYDIPLCSKCFKRNKNDKILKK